VKGQRVVVDDLMQRGYVYFRTEPAGRNFEAGFEPQLTPREMLALGVFGGKYMTDCRSEFPASWLVRREAQLLRRSGVAAAHGVAEEGLDLRGGSARLVSMVLPLLHGPPLPG
jgi:hypothetical protein